MTLREYRRSFRPVWRDEGADGDGSSQPLSHIEITGRLVEHETRENNSRAISADVN